MNFLVKKKLLNNFFSLSSIQIISYILPLITIPYLVRVLGVEKFGLIAFAQATIQYFVLISDYGFGLSGTKQISQNINNKSKIINIFSTLIFLKIFFIISSFITLILMIYNFKIFYESKEIFLLTFGIVIGQALFPVWFFQGIEKMKITALINIIPKIFFTLSIFLIVKNEEDYLLVPIINSLGFIFSAILSLYISFKVYKIKIIFPNLLDFKYQLKEGWHIFLGILSSNFSILNVSFFLGILTNPTFVGYYAAVEKIIRPIASLNRPVINAIFPHLAKSITLDKMSAIKLSKKVTKFAIIFMGLIGISLFLLSDFLILILFGENFIESSNILKIMAFIPMLQSIIHIYAVPNMILFEYKKAYSNIMLISLIFNTLFSILFIKTLNYFGAAYVSLLTELFILVCLSFYLKKNKGLHNDY